MSSIDFLVKLRDAAQMIADAANEELEKKAPPEVKEDFDKLSWEAKQGSKGPYEQTYKELCKNSSLFQALQTILKEHNGFVHLGEYRYWLDRGNPDIIDRRKK